MSEGEEEDERGAQSMRGGRGGMKVQVLMCSQTRKQKQTPERLIAPSSRQDTPHRAATAAVLSVCVLFKST